MPSPEKLWALGLIPTTEENESKGGRKEERRGGGRKRRRKMEGKREGEMEEQKRNLKLL